MIKPWYEVDGNNTKNNIGSDLNNPRDKKSKLDGNKPGGGQGLFDMKMSSIAISPRKLLPTTPSNNT